MRRPLYAYEYADVPYDDAIAILAERASALLQEATDASVAHTDEVVTHLTVDAGGFEVGRDVVVELGEFDPVELIRARLPISWRAASRPALFPSMTGALEVASLSSHPPRVQVTILGDYEPPLGVLGSIADSSIGHRVAEAAAHRLVHEVVTRLEAQVAARRASTTGDAPSVGAAEPVVGSDVPA